MSIIRVDNEIVRTLEIGTQGPPGPPGPQGPPGEPNGEPNGPAGEPLEASTSTVYVAKHGDDDNDGLAIDRPKLTISDALTVAAEWLSPADPGDAIPGVLVDVLDAGVYEEDLTVPAGCHVRAPAITLFGTITISANAEIHVGRQYSTANDQNLVTLDTAKDGPAIFECYVQDAREHERVQNVRNIGGGGKNLFVRVGIMFVGEDGVGVGDATSGFGHIHIEIEDLYLGGDGAVGILAGATGGPNVADIVGVIHHILPITPPPATTTGILMTNANAIVKLTASEIRATVAYDVSGGGELYLMTPFIEGTRTGTPAFELSPETFPPAPD